jgi:hypothetical protein
MNRAAATPEQLCEITQSLDRLDLECQSIRNLTATVYGCEDERSSRAEELCNQLQRLRWALERGGRLARLEEWQGVIARGSR